MLSIPRDVSTLYTEYTNTQHVTHCPQVYTLHNVLQQKLIKMFHKNLTITYTHSLTCRSYDKCSFRHHRKNTSQNNARIRKQTTRDVNRRDVSWIKRDVMWITEMCCESVKPTHRRADATQLSSWVASKVCIIGHEICYVQCNYHYVQNHQPETWLCSEYDTLSWVIMAFTVTFQLTIADFISIYNMLTYRTVNSAVRLRHFCLDSGATAQCKLY